MRGLRRRLSEPVQPVESVRDAELALQRRSIKWLGTTAITWPVWALTGAPTGLPHATANHHHVVATLGIWPAYLMIGGLADVARRARRLYVERDWTTEDE